jgi:hypothetical protein
MLYNKIIKKIFPNRGKTKSLSEQWQDVINNSSLVLDNGKNKKSKKILFATSYGQTKWMLGVETALATCLKLRNHEPYFLICDHSLPACEWNKWGDMSIDLSDYKPRFDDPYYVNYNCDLCTDQLTSSLSNFNYHQVKFSSIKSINNKKIKMKEFDDFSINDCRDYTYKGIKVGMQAMASVIRSLMVAYVEDDKYTRWLARRYLLAAINIVDYFEHIIETIKPDRVVLTHGVYVTHGTILLMAQKYGIPSFVYGRNYRSKAITIVKDQTYHLSFFDLDDDKWNIELTKEKREKISSYLLSREWGGEDHTTYHKNPKKDKKKIIEECNINESLPIVTLFTNVVWDAQVSYPVNIFDNMLDWLFAEIEHFKNRNDIQLIIRIHPSEARGVGTKQPIYNEINNRYSDLPDNIILIKAESDISSYTLAEMSIATLVYCSIIGFEIATRGIPVVLAGEASYRNKGFTYDINSMNEFHKFNENILNLGKNPVEMVERSLRFAYYYFFKATIDFPIVGETTLNGNVEPFLNFSSLEELKPGNNDSVDAICDGIINNVNPAELV